MPPAQQSGLDWLHRWGPAFLMMGLIFAASSLPAQSIPSWPGWVDLALKKGGHMLGYGLLAIAVIRGVGKDKPQAYRLSWVIVLLYAITDEFHQKFVPGRGSSALDVLIDGFGAAFALLIYRSWKSFDVD